LFEPSASGAKKGALNRPPLRKLIASVKASGERAAAASLRRCRCRGGHLVVHVVVVMVVMMMVVVVHLRSHRGGRWRGFLRKGVTCEADRESGGGE
jgi:hypothetical protein